MNRNEVIKQLKESITSPSFWSEDMKTLAQELFLWLDFWDGGKWVRNSEDDSDIGLIDSLIYRLRPSYKQDKGNMLVELPIFEDGGIRCIKPEGFPMPISYVLAPSVTELDGVKYAFAGYRFEDGCLKYDPVFYSLKCSNTTGLGLEFPTNVLFRKVV